jgi:hypothetical protein
MRRTARSLPLAAATGAALAALAPAAFAGTVPDDGASWGTASHSPCPEPGEHEWEPDALGPAGPEVVAPKSTDLDELDAELGLEEEIPAPEESDPAEPGAVGPKAPKPGPGESRTPGPEPSESKATPCADAPVPQGVHAGEGGAFTDSVPALAAGGLLIAGAFGAAVHRVYRDRTAHADG